MDISQATQFLLGCTAISWAATSAVLFCRGPQQLRTLGACFLAGAMLATADALSTASIALPLAAILTALTTTILVLSNAFGPATRQPSTHADAKEPAPTASAPTPTILAANKPTPTASATPDLDIPATVDADRSTQPTALTPSSVLRDLRNPLTSVLAAMQLADDGDGQRNSEMMVQLRTYGRQLSTAMADIDDLNSLLNGSIDLTEDVFDLRELLSTCIDEVTPQADDREVALRFDPLPTLPQWVQGDPLRTRQLCLRLLHLATNRCTIGPVEICASASDDQIHISLLNIHIGIEDQDSLGVTFARELAKSLGGQLHISPRETGGTQFHLILPKTIAPAWEVDLMVEDAATNQLLQPRPTPKITGVVLLVTSNRDHQHLLADVITRIGAEVTTADNGEMALHMVEEQAFELVLLDMQCDGHNGLQTARRLREHGITSPMIALTTDCSGKFIEECLAAGCNDHLAKPIDPDMLQGALTMHLATAD